MSKPLRRAHGRGTAAESNKAVLLQREVDGRHRMEAGCIEERYEAILLLEQEADLGASEYDALCSVFDKPMNDRQELPFRACPSIIKYELLVDDAVHDVAIRPVRHAHVDSMEFR